MTLRRRNWPLDDYRSFNALAETVNGLYKAELINRHGPWRTVDEVELATAEWAHFWNTRRLHSACGDVPPGGVRGRLPSAATGDHRGRVKSNPRVSTKPRAVHLVAVGSFLPWATVMSGFGQIDLAGTSGDGILTIVVGAVIALAAFLNVEGPGVGRTGPLSRRHRRRGDHHRRHQHESSGHLPPVDTESQSRGPNGSRSQLPSVALWVSRKGADPGSAGQP